jgi:hypothetical protein
MSEFISKIVQYSPILVIVFIFGYYFIASRIDKMKQSGLYRKSEFQFDLRVKNAFKLIVFCSYNIYKLCAT